MRYAILHHTGIEPAHFDVLFESAPGSQLTAFRVDQWPIRNRTAATSLRDHRRLYLTYEGDIPGDRGHVRRVEAGGCNVAREGDAWVVVFFSECDMKLGVRFDHDGHQEWYAAPFHP
jgi:hypothetical protein